MKSIILDTNAYTEYLAGNQEVLYSMSNVDRVYLSVIVLGELYSGFRGGKKYLQNTEILQKFLSKPTVEVQQVTDETSEIFGQTKHILKQAGTPIPINDVWIASQTIETGSVLVTFDSHFAKIPGLRIWDKSILDLRS